MPSNHRPEPSHLDRICEIAARLNEDAAVLRILGLHEAARLLSVAEAHLDDQVYASCHAHEATSGLLPEPPRARRTRPRSARH